MNVTKCDCCGIIIEDLVVYSTGPDGDICDTCNNAINRRVSDKCNERFDEQARKFGAATAQAVKLANLIEGVLSLPDAEEKWGVSVMGMYYEWKRLTDKATLTSE